MSLNDLMLKSSDNRWNDELGIEEWILQYSIPNSRINAEKVNYRASLSNTLPVADSDEMYPPCIHRARLSADPENPNAKLLTVLYRRPSEAMILQPGRGMLEFDSYTTTKTEEVPVFDDGSSLTNQARVNNATTFNGYPVNNITFASKTVTLKRKEALVTIERGVLIVKASDWASEELALYERAASWIGYGGKFMIMGKQWKNLKCAKIEISRNANDVSRVMSRWHFAQNPDGWKEAGVLNEEWYAVDVNGNELPIDPANGVRPTGTYMAIKLRNTESDVIKGTKDFTAMGNYFKWME